MKASDFKTSGKRNPAERNEIAVLKFCSDWKSSEEIVSGLELSREAVSQTLREVLKEKLVVIEQQTAMDKPKKLKITSKGKKWLSDFGQ